MHDALFAAWGGHATAQLRDALAPRETPGIFAFDFDNTCVEGDTGELLHLYLSDHLLWDLPSFVAHVAPEDGQAELAALVAAYAADGSSREALRQALILAFPRRLARLGPVQTYEWGVRLHAGMPLVELRLAIRGMLHEEATRPRVREQIGEGEDAVMVHRGLRSRPALRALMAAGRMAGTTSWVISATNEWAVEQAARDFGVDAAQVVGNRTVVANGRITSTRNRPVTWRHGKVHALEQETTQRPRLAVGDSWTDFELLDYAESAIVIDRGDQQLVDAARERGWGIVPAAALASEPWGLHRR